MPMTFPSLRALLAGATPTIVKQGLSAFLSFAGFPTTAWQTTSVPRRFLEGEGSALADLVNTVAQVAAGGLVLFSTGPWLDQLGENLYNAPRKQAVFSQGTIQITDAGGAGPWPINPGFAVQNPFTLHVYQYLGAATTLPAGGTISLTMQAAVPGSAYNDAPSTALTLVTSLPGVVATSPPIGITGSWLTQFGSDQESDGAYQTRLIAQWPTLGGGATAAAILNWSLNASPEITRVQVSPATPAPGYVTVVLASAGGGVSSGAVTSWQSFVGPRLPICVAASATSATTVPVKVLAAPVVKSANAKAARATALANLATLMATAPIGDGQSVTLYADQIRQAILAADPTIKAVELSSPSSDLVLKLGQIPILDAASAITPTVY